MAGAKNSKYTSAKKITLKKSSITLAAGKTAKIKASVILKNKAKKLIDHCKKLRYQSSSTQIATVNSAGKITAKMKGTCYIYVNAPNGMTKKVKVTVK